MSTNSKVKRDSKAKSRIKCAKHMFKFGRNLRRKNVNSVLRIGVNRNVCKRAY